jgi:hypothetical protein
MNKIIYTLGFLLIFSLFNNNAKAQSVADVDPCIKNASGQIVITTTLGASDQTCDTSGTTNLTINIYSLGFCTSAPSIKFITGARTTDGRDSSSSINEAAKSDFSSCTWTIKESSPSSESLESVGDVEALPNEEMPPPGTYTHAVLVISNTLQISGVATFEGTIKDTTSAETEGNYCWTNGSYFLDTGKIGPHIGTTLDLAKTNRSNGIIRGGATCGSSPPASPTANNIVYYFLNYEGGGTSVNTTRSEESTAFGTLSVFYTQADLNTLATNDPIILRPIIQDGVGKDGTETLTNTLTLVFAYNTPMKVTNNTTGMDIFLNFSNALSVDFEPINMASGTLITNRNDGKVTLVTGSPAVTSEPTSFPRIKAIQSGPFGIQFKAVEGGGTN